MIKKTHLISTIGAIAGASFALGTFAADTSDNPFQADDLDTGFTAHQASFGDDDKEGSCGEGSCGEDDDHDDDEEGSCGEGSCGEGDDDEEGSCGEGSCGAS